MKRIIFHWTAGTNKVSEEDKLHYHYIIAGDGTIVPGKYKVLDNMSVADGKYAAHTLNCNKDSIGVSLAGMYNAVQEPFNAGKYPINQTQWKVLVKLITKLAKDWQIPVTPKTILSHAEVQGTLGIKQKQKWDISRLPWDKTVVGATAVGNLLRKQVALTMEKM